MIDNIPTATVFLGTGDGSQSATYRTALFQSRASRPSHGYLLFVFPTRSNQLLFFWIFPMSNLSAFRCICCHGCIALDHAQVRCRNINFIFQICKNKKIKFSDLFQQLQTHSCKIYSVVITILLSLIRLTRDQYYDVLFKN